MIFLALLAVPVAALISFSLWYVFIDLPQALRLFAASTTGFMLPLIFSLAFFFGSRADVTDPEFFEVIKLYLLTSIVLCVVSAGAAAGLAMLRRK
jgi:hypothetical protein